jgi:hypothetical protein
MFCQRSVARLAVDVGMLATLLFFQDIRVAVLAGLVAGELHRTGGDFSDGVSAVVSVLTEALRYERRSDSQKHQYPGDEYSR